MRAASQNRDVAQLMGINPTASFAVAFGIALALAGAAGSLLMPFYPAYPMVGQVFVLMAFVAVVLGSLGNVIGALVASLMMGVAESLGIQFIGADSGLIVVFLLLLPTLAVRPSGLAGGERADDGSETSSLASSSRSSWRCRWWSQPFRARHPHPDSAVLVHRRRLESDGRIRQAIIPRPRRLFRARRLHLDDHADRLRHLAVDRHVRGRRGRRWRACRSAGCASGCVGPTSPSPPSPPRRC